MLWSKIMECFTLPYKNLENLNSFIDCIKYWDGGCCNYKVWKHATSRKLTLTKTKIFSWLNLTQYKNFVGEKLSWIIISFFIKHKRFIYLFEDMHFYICVTSAQSRFVVNRDFPFILVGIVYSIHYNLSYQH